MVKISFEFVFYQYCILVFVVNRKMLSVPITSCVMIVVLKIISVVNVDKIKIHLLSNKILFLHDKYCLICFSLNYRRPVPAVQEEREQAEFEIDVKLLRERERRRFS